MIGPVVCLINRTSHPLTVTKNGRRHVLVPGENYVNAELVAFAKAQNPLKGSRDPYTLVFVPLVGIKDTRDDCSPIDDETLAMMPQEVIDRGQLPADRQDISFRQTSFPRGRVGVDGPTTGMVDPGAQAFTRD